MSEQCYVVTGPSGEVYRVRADFEGEPSEQDLEDLGAHMDAIADAARKKMTPKCGDHKYAVEPPRTGRPPDPPSPVCSKEPGHEGRHRGRGSGGRGYVEWPNDSTTEQPLEASDE